MNNPNNLFNMMQTGGLTSTAGGTALARALQMQSDRKRLEQQARSEAERQKRGGLFGSIGSLAGGIGGLFSCDERVKVDIEPLITTEVNDDLAQAAFFVKELRECS